MAVCTSEAKVGGAYIAVVTEPAPTLPEIAEVEEEAEMAEEAPIAPPGECLWRLKQACVAFKALLRKRLQTEICLDTCLQTFYGSLNSIAAHCKPNWSSHRYCLQYRVLAVE